MMGTQPSSGLNDQDSILPRHRMHHTANMVDPKRIRKERKEKEKNIKDRTKKKKRNFPYKPHSIEATTVVPRN